MKTLVLITLSCLLNTSLLMAEDIQQKHSDNTSNHTTELANNNPGTDRQQDEQRAEKLNQTMELKIDELNDIMQQQIAIRFDFELDD